MSESPRIPDSVPVPHSNSFVRLLLNPYLHLFLNGLLVSASELLLKRGAMETHGDNIPAWLVSIGAAFLCSWWVWGGIVIYILSFLNWLHVLKWIPLSIAFPIAATVHVFIPIGAWIFLGETVSIARWAGIGLIIVGICFMSNSVAHAEEVI